MNCSLFFLIHLFTQWGLSLSLPQWLSLSLCVCFFTFFFPESLVMICYSHPLIQCLFLSLYIYTSVAILLSFQLSPFSLSLLSFSISAVAYSSSLPSYWHLLSCLFPLTVSVYFFFFTLPEISLCRPFWLVLLFLPLWFSLCPTLSPFLSPCISLLSIC